MGNAASLEARLRQAFSPVELEILDESHRHAGHHESFDGSGETHLRVRIVSEAFSGMSRIGRHRAINALADEAMANGLHALAIEAKAPGEPSRR